MTKRAAAKKARPKPGSKNTVEDGKNDKKLKPSKDAVSETETGFEPQYFLDINHWFESRPTSVVSDDDDTESDKHDKQLGPYPESFS